MNKFEEILSNFNEEKDKSYYPSLEPKIIKDTKFEINKFINEMIGFENKSNVLLLDSENIKDQKSILEFLEVFSCISRIHSHLSTITQRGLALGDFFESSFYSSGALVLNNLKVLEKMEQKLSIILNKKITESVKTSFKKFDRKTIFSIIYFSTLYSVENQIKSLKINPLKIKEISSDFIIERIKGSYYISNIELKKYVDRFNLERTKKGWFYSAQKMSLSVTAILFFSFVILILLSAFYPHPNIIPIWSMIIIGIVLPFIGHSFLFNIFTTTEKTDKYNIESYLIVVFIFAYVLIISFLNYLSLNYIMLGISLFSLAGLVYLTNLRSLLVYNKYLKEIGAGVLGIAFVYANFHDWWYPSLVILISYGFYFVFRLLPRRFLFWVK
jgi:hypothetical protein